MHVLRTVGMTDDDGETPLHTACKKGKLDIVKYLVQVAHCDVGKSGLSFPVQVFDSVCCSCAGVTDINGDTPVVSAENNDHTEIVDFLKSSPEQGKC